MNERATAATGGQVIGGRYLLKELVGRGGMATVWRAEHLMLKSDVAVKFLELGSGATGELRDRFLREARVAAQVRHRNVVQVLDFGATPEGQPYMVMEMLPGRSLTQRLVEDGAMSVLDTVRLGARLLSGLAAAHEAGVVHRDVKPDNVLLVTDAGDEYPKLIDFGISRVTRADATVSSVVATSENVAVGTPEYMSPEQARGLADLDARTDVYSVGVVLYELLTGQRPHSGELPADVMAKILTEDPAPIESLRPDLPRELAEVIARAMSRDRERRFPDAVAFRSALVSATADLLGDNTGRRSAVDLADSMLPAALGSGGADVVIPRAARAPKDTDRRGPFAGLPLWLAAVAVVTMAAAIWLWMDSESVSMSARPLPPASGPAVTLTIPAPAPLPAPVASAEMPSPGGAAVEPIAPAAPIVAPGSPAAPAASSPEGRPSPRRRHRAEELLRDPGF